MKINQQTADDLKKQISARSVALNQFNLDLEAKAEEMTGMIKQAKDYAKEVEKTKKEMLSAQEDALKAKKLAEQFVKEAAGKEQLKLEKQVELKEVEKQVNSAKFDLAGLQERMDMDYATLQNRYNVFKKSIQKNMEKLREDIR